MAFKVLDLFSGAGGLSRGFYDAGYDIVLGVDFDEAALKTFKENHGGAEAMKLDLLPEEYQGMYKYHEELTRYHCENAQLKNIVDGMLIKEMAFQFRKKEYHRAEKDRNTALLIVSKHSTDEDVNFSSKVKIEDDPYYFKNMYFHMMK